MSKKLGVKEVEKLVREMRKSGFKGLKGVGEYLSIEFKENTQSWVYRFTFVGKQKKKGLGSLSDVSLADARKKIQKYRALVLDGINPINEEKKKIVEFKKAVEQSEKQKVKFKACALEYIELQKPQWKFRKDGRCKTLESWQSTLENHAFPILGDMPLQDITIDHIIKVLQPIWYKIPPTAEKIRTRLENILTYAKIKKYRSGENPAAWIGNLKAIFPSINEIHTETPYASMTYEEVPSFFSQLHKKNTVASKALRLTILTGVRTNMTRYAQPEHFVDGVWEIPEELMKKGVEHKIKLSPQVMDLVNNLMIVDGWMFPGQIKGKPISDGAMTSVLKDLGRPDVTVHGFRSSVRTWITEATNFKAEVGNKLLAHKLTKDPVAARYDRANLTEARAQALCDWADHCYREINFGG
jgi:integrase